MNEPTDPPIANEPPATEIAPPSRGSILAGLGLGIGVLLLHVGVLAFPSQPWVLWILFTAGFTQWLLVIPLAIMLRRRRLTATVNGLLIIAGSACIINSACCGMFLLPSVLR